jgi:hypothetical protein
MNDLAPDELSLAPSEEVFLALQGRLSKPDLLTMTLKAALLACEDAGVIRFSVAATTGPRSVLSPHTITVTPTGHAVEWPPHSIEDRLRFGEHEAPRDLIYQWLCGEAADPWALGVDKVWIGLAIRGLATVTRRRFNRFAYGVGSLAAAHIAVHSEQLDRLTAAQQGRAQLWTLLDREIARAMDRAASADSEGRRPDADPWEAEAEADRLRVLGPEQMTPLTILMFATFSGVIAIMDGFVAWNQGHLAWAGVSAAVVIVLGTVDLLPWPPPVRRVLTAMSQSTRFRKAPGAAAATLTAKARMTGLAIATPLVVLVSLIAAAFGWVGKSIAVIGVGMGVWWLLKRVSGAAISDRVAQQGVAATAANDDQTASSPVHRAGSASPGRRLRLEVVRPAELPEPSPNAQARFQVVEERGVALRRTYRLLVSQCATAYVLIISAAAVWRGQFPFHSKGITAAWVLWAATILVMWGRVFVALRRRRAGKNPQETQAVQTIQPMAHAVAGALWFGITVLTIPAYVKSAWPVTWLLLASVCLYVVQSRRTRSALERRYPVVAPANLLALRVFGSPSLKDFMALTSYWRWMGTTQRLDGPDTSGDKTADVLAVMTGRANERIVKTEQDLAAALAAFREDTDGELRYTLNSMQCSNATWQQALDRLLGKADVVVMDLSGFSSERLGCKYELGTLVEKTGLDRVLLLVDDSTDLGLLEHVLHDAWKRTSPDSPNHLAEHPVTLVRTGGLSDRQPDESVYEWQRRLQMRLGGKRLVGRLVDMAVAASTSAGVSRIDAVRVVQWPRPWTGGVAGVLRMSLLVLVVLVSLLASTCVYLIDAGGTQLRVGPGQVLDSST